MLCCGLPHPHGLHKGLSFLDTTSATQPFSRAGGLHQRRCAGGGTPHCVAHGVLPFNSRRVDLARVTAVVVF